MFYLQKLKLFCICFLSWKSIQYAEASNRLTWRNVKVLLEYSKNNSCILARPSISSKWGEGGRAIWSSFLHNILKIIGQDDQRRMEEKPWPCLLSSHFAKMTVLTQKQEKVNSIQDVRHRVLLQNCCPNCPAGHKYIMKLSLISVTMISSHL